MFPEQLEQEPVVVCRIGESDLYLKSPYLKLTEFRQLRNRKRFQCFLRVMVTRVEGWENEKAAFNLSFFSFSKTFADDIVSLWKL